MKRNMAKGAMDPANEYLNYESWIMISLDRNSAFSYFTSDMYVYRVVSCLLRICVYLCKCAHELVEKTWLFSIMRLEKGITLFTP